jgi:hypothetical protein
MDDGERQSPLRGFAANALARLRLRRREPWNWLAQTAGLCFLAPGLLFHSPALLAFGALGILGGLLPIALPPMQHTELRRILPFLERLIGLESAWLARPLDRRKKWQIACLAGGGPLTALLLWMQDLGPIGLALIVVALAHVRRKNMEQGIDP